MFFGEIGEIKNLQNCVISPEKDVNYIVLEADLHCLKKKRCKFLCENWGSFGPFSGVLMSFFYYLHCFLYIFNINYKSSIVLYTIYVNTSKLTKTVIFNVNWCNTI